MSMLQQSEQEQVAKAIEDVEKQTDAELVAVLAKRSDSYYYIPTLWAAIVALLTPTVLSFLPLMSIYDDVLTVQLAVFIVFALIFRLPCVVMKLVPKAVRYSRASLLARSQFLENNLHHTVGDSGVLIFVSEAEHYVEIIADRGISQKVDQQQWQDIVDNFIVAVKDKQTLTGFLGCIDACGKLLHEHVPATGDKNELPNHLIVLD